MFEKESHIPVVLGNPQKKVQWSQIRQMWRPFFKTAIPNYLVPEIRDELRLHWKVLQKNRALRSAEVVNTLHLLRYLRKILNRSASYCKFPTKFHTKSHMMSKNGKKFRNFKLPLMGMLPIVHAIP